MMKPHIPQHIPQINLKTIQMLTTLAECCGMFLKTLTREKKNTPIYVTRIRAGGLTPPKHSATFRKVT